MNTPVALPSKLHTIQSYRALVAFVIVLSHAFIVVIDRGFSEIPFLTLRTGGVDFFFTLSGFLIYHVYASKGRGAQPARSFFRKRVVRIYPLVWTFTLLSLPFYLLGGKYFGSGQERHAGVIIKSLLLIPQDCQPVLGAMWSLSHVVFFYAAFCLYLWRPLLGRASALVWLGAWVLWSATGMDVGEFENGPHYLLAFLFNPLNIEFLLGALLARAIEKTSFPSPAVALALGMAGFPLAWACFNSSSPALPVALAYCASSLLLILGGVELDRRYRTRTPRWIDSLSVASYAIIIVNLPVLIAWVVLIKRLSWLDPGSRLDATVLLLSGTLLAMVGGVMANTFIEPGVSKWVDKGIDLAFRAIGVRGPTDKAAPSRQA